MAHQAVASGVRPGAAARLITNTLGVRVTSKQVSRNTQSSKLAILLAGEAVFEAEKKTMSDVDIITGYLRSTNHYYTALYHSMRHIIYYVTITCAALAVKFDLPVVRIPTSSRVILARNNSAAVNFNLSQLLLWSEK